jgi:hypothetical protein
MKIIKIVSLLLATLMTFGVFVSCKEEESSSEQRPQHTERPYEEKNEILINKEGVSDFKILLPENATSTLEFAAEELNWIIREGFGTTLEVVEETQTTDLNGKWLSIGFTSLAKSISVSYEELGLDGYRLKTERNSVVMCGYSERSNIFAVYGFAEKTFGYDFIADDEICI